MTPATILTVGPRFGGRRGLYGSVLGGMVWATRDIEVRPMADAHVGYTFVTPRGAQLGPELTAGSSGFGVGFSVRWPDSPVVQPVSPAPS